MREPARIWGKQPVAAYLDRLAGGHVAKPSMLHVLTGHQGHASNSEVVAKAQALGLAVQHHRDLETWPVDRELAHQRLCLDLAAYPVHSLEASLARLGDLTGAPRCVGVVFDCIQDPGNFGNALRAAAYFGAKFAVFGQDRQAPLTPVVTKASAGGAFELDLIPVVNIARSCRTLKEAGLWILGADSKEGEPGDGWRPSLGQLATDPRHFVLVLGNEAKGLRPEVAKACDGIARIPGPASRLVDSLNVAAAASILLHALSGP